MTKTSIRTSVLATVIVGMLSGSAIAAQKAPRQGEPPKVNVATMGDQQAFGRFIITYKDGSTTRNNRTAITKNASTALSRAGLSTKAKPTTATYLRKLAVGADLVKTSRKLDRAEAEAFMRQIAADPAVANVTVDRLRRPVRDLRAPANLAPQTFTPNDTYYGAYQWHLKAPDGTATANGVPNLGGSNVNNAWDLADGAGVVIAVLDTGITQHPDMDTSLADAGYDFITDSFVSGRATDGRVPGGWDTGDWTTEEPWLSECTDASNPPEDSSWHGTHVAGTAGAELTNNGAGMAGVAYNAKILPVRVLGHCGGYDSDINDAIIWAAGGHVDGVPDNANPAQVINLSLGGIGACPATDPQAQAIAQANALGATVVVSAGNSGADASNYSPASCPGAVTVASTGIYSKRAFYSNYGAPVEIAAPGGGVYPNDGSSGSPINDGFVWQAINDGTKEPTTTYAYLGYAGTSQAAPHVSGTVALMRGARADAGMAPLTPTEVVAILQSTAHAPSSPPTQPIGAGIVDAAAAVAAAIEPPCTENCGPVATPLTNKVEVKGLSGAAGSEKLYSFEAQAGAVLSFMTYGGSGNVSVYVSLGSEPTTTDYDAKSTRAGNSETVRFTAPQAGTYYIKLVGAGNYSGVTLVARQ
jgi:serine protease